MTVSHVFVMEYNNKLCIFIAPEALNHLFFTDWTSEFVTTLMSGSPSIHPSARPTSSSSASLAKTNVHSIAISLSKLKHVPILHNKAIVAIFSAIT